MSHINRRHAFFEFAGREGMPKGIVAETDAEMRFKSHKPTLYRRRSPWVAARVCEDDPISLAASNDPFGTGSKIDDAVTLLPFGLMRRNDGSVSAKIKVAVVKDLHFIRPGTDVPGDNKKFTELLTLRQPQNHFHLLDGNNLFALGLCGPPHGGDRICVDPSLGVCPSVSRFNSRKPSSLRAAIIEPFSDVQWPQGRR